MPVKLSPSKIDQLGIMFFFVISIMPFWFWDAVQYPALVAALMWLVLMTYSWRRYQDGKRVSISQQGSKLLVFVDDVECVIRDVNFHSRQVILIIVGTDKFRRKLLIFADQLPDDIYRLLYKQVAA